MLPAGFGRHHTRTLSSIRSRAPKASTDAVRRVMQANVGRATLPERTLRSLLHAHGLRFRKNHRPSLAVPCKADVVLARAKMCIFVDGCFWHGCPTHFKLPTANAEWWDEKVRDNIERDCRNNELLAEEGWLVIRLWEHDILGDSLLIVTHMIEQVYSHRRGHLCKSGPCRSLEDSLMPPLQEW